MICPFCHAEVADGSSFCTSCGAKLPSMPPEPAPAAFCTHCGAPVSPGARFCTSCGARIVAPDADTPAPDADAPVPDPMPAGETVVDMARIAVAPAPASTSTSATAPDPYAPTSPQDFTYDAAPKKKMSRGKVAAIAVGALVVAGLAGGGIWYAVDQQNQRAAAEQAAQAKQRAQDLADAQHDVKISVSADGWNTHGGASRLPVHVVGTASTGDAVDETQFVDSDGEGLTLRQGTYELSVVASPIAADGTLYAVPMNTLQVSFTSDDVNENIDATGVGSFALTPVAALDVTTELITAAYAQASADTAADAPNADELRDAAQSRHDDAAAQKAADDAAAAEREKREARRVATADYELYLPEYWDGRVNVQEDGNKVAIYANIDSRLEMCWIEVHSTPRPDAIGDVATSWIGSALLGPGEYAWVYANRWGYIIADFNHQNSSDPDTYYSFEEAEEVVDLETGGAIDYDTILNDFGERDYSYLVDDYIAANIVDAIQPL